MISSHRTTKAFEQGKLSAIHTRCCPQRTVNPYCKYTAQGRAFSKGYSEILNRSGKMLRPVHKAMKYAD